MFNQQIDGNSREPHEAQICIFTELFGLKIFVTSLNVPAEVYHSCFKSVDYQEEVDSVRLREDGLIVHFADDLMLMFNFKLSFNERNQIVDFELHPKLSLKEANLRIFENICLFTKNHRLVLNSFNSEGNSVNLNQEGIFNIASLLSADYIESQSTKAPFNEEPTQLDSIPVLPNPFEPGSTGSELHLLFHAFFLKGGLGC